MGFVVALIWLFGVCFGLGICLLLVVVLMRLCCLILLFGFVFGVFADCCYFLGIVVFWFGKHVGDGGCGLTCGL